MRCGFLVDAEWQYGFEARVR
eukprot:SAG11_NODE_6720_length_1260_cov_3.586563_1_plen_20_part_01